MTFDAVVFAESDRKGICLFLQGPREKALGSFPNPQDRPVCSLIW